MCWQWPFYIEKNPIYSKLVTLGHLSISYLFVTGYSPMPVESIYFLYIDSYPFFKYQYGVKHYSMPNDEDHELLVL